MQLVINLRNMLSSSCSRVARVLVHDTLNQGNAATRTGLLRMPGCSVIARNSLSRMPRDNVQGQSGLFTRPHRDYKGQASLLHCRKCTLSQGLRATADDQAGGMTSLCPIGSSFGSTLSRFSYSASKVRRRKREDCKDDALGDFNFSEWKILIGPTDWGDYKLGIEGAEKYRTQNLPNHVSCPGVYELAVFKFCHESGTKTRKLGSSIVCPVYVGQSENVRTRLQRYGRDGDHLTELFQEMVQMGYGIAYRWIPMRGKKDAEEAEEHLLGEYDYAWNNDRNLARRKDDVLIWLNRNMEDKGSDLHGMIINNSIFSHGNQGADDACGVAIGSGKVCNVPPVKGRKRCAAHKGRRVNGNVKKVNSISPASIFVLGLAKIRSKIASFLGPLLR